MNESGILIVPPTAGGAPIAHTLLPAHLIARLMIVGAAASGSLASLSAAFRGSAPELCDQLDERATTLDAAINAIADAMHPTADHGIPESEVPY